jgi:hypothetical protein
MAGSPASLFRLFTINENMRKMRFSIEDENMFKLHTPLKHRGFSVDDGPRMSRRRRQTKW